MDIVSVVLGIEADGFDAIVSNYGSDHHYDMGGLDVVIDEGRRTDVRQSFAYYAGVSASQTPGRLGSSNRRRFVILNGVENSPSHGKWEILHNSSRFSRSNTSMVRDLIDSVEPASQIMEEEGTFKAWLAEKQIPEAVNAPSADADGDGWSNLQEYYFGTEPLKPDGHDAFQVTQSPGSGDYRLHYRQRRDAMGVSLRLWQSGDLVAWKNYIPPMDSVTTVAGEDFDYVTIVVPRTEPVMHFTRLEMALDDAEN